MRECNQNDIAHPNGWAAKPEGGEQRPSSADGSQLQADDQGRKIKLSQSVELFIHGRDSRILNGSIALVIPSRHRAGEQVGAEEYSAFSSVERIWPHHLTCADQTHAVEGNE